MPPFPSVSGKDVVRALEKAGFELVRVRGSHHRLANPAPASLDVTVPVHGNRDLPKGTLRKILADAGLSVEEFRDLL